MSAIQIRSIILEQESKIGQHILTMSTNFIGIKFSLAEKPELFETSRHF